MDGRRTVSEIARSASAPAGTAVRTLAALIRAGCLERVGTGQRAVKGPETRAPEPCADGRSQPEREGSPVTKAPGRYAMRGAATPQEAPERRAWLLPREIRSERAAILELSDQVHQLDHYRILALRPGASPEAIEKAYRHRVVRFAPRRADEPGLRDLADDLERVHHGIEIAYQTLANAERRREYDGGRDREHRAADAVQKANQATTSAYLDTASRLIRRGHIPDAIPVLKEALRLTPESAVLHYRVGQCLAATSADHTKARYHFQRAADLEPTNPRYPAALASLRPEPSRERQPLRSLAERISRLFQGQTPSTTD